MNPIKSAVDKTPQSGPEQEQSFSCINSEKIDDPIIDILRADFEFENDSLVLFSAVKCPGGCPDC